eukprot:GFUD01029955.1.p1 GENE.GFUD01029955.1~~GFUD01029955.1.p1  ORF type:complete len:183 (-),score=37.25 GFUD01029955.1:33-530(-)
MAPVLIAVLVAVVHVGAQDYVDTQDEGDVYEGDVADWGRAAAPIPVPPPRPQYPWEMIDNIYIEEPPRHEDPYEDYYPRPYPTTAAPTPHCPQRCDTTDWPACQCVQTYGDMYTQDRRGNCNVGADKPDLQVWCFVDPHTSVCPDTRESTLMTGKYWSRFACITE